VTARVKEPTSRAGIIASGLVRIIATPAALDAAGGWWSPEKPGQYPTDVRRARAEGMKAGAPRWLAKPVTPHDAVARMFKDAESERRAACRYLGGKVYALPAQMSPTQLRAALATQHRRLSGQWGDDKALDVVVAPLDAATLEMLPTSPEPLVETAPEPEAVAIAATPEIPAFEPEPVTAWEPDPEPLAIAAAISAAEPEPGAVPIAAERTPEPVAATVTQTPEPARPRPPTTPSPKPAPEPEPTPYRPRGRDRLAWVPVMARLAEKYRRGAR
jgi:hypothetical protein